MTSPLAQAHHGRRLAHGAYVLSIAARPHSVSADHSIGEVIVAGGEAAHPADTERLNTYWAEGAGAAKIRWGQPGDFDRCSVEMRKLGVPGPMIPGHCANLHKRATGAWPGHAASEQKPSP